MSTILMPALLVDADAPSIDNQLMTFTQTFTPTPAVIDELGHVNNAVWVRWM